MRHSKLLTQPPMRWQPIFEQRYSTHSFPVPKALLLVSHPRMSPMSVQSVVLRLSIAAIQCLGCQPYRNALGRHNQLEYHEH